MSAKRGKKRRIYLNLAQSGLILHALAELPFKSVYELIGDLNQQAHRLYPDGASAETAQIFVFEAKDLALCIEALGELPFNRVNALLSNLHQQLLTASSEVEHGGI